jgi:hypothetical protein
VPEQVELANRQLHLGAVDLRDTRAPVEDDVAGHETVVLTLGLCTPQHRSDACDELTRRERLRHVVVRPELETGDAVDLLVARGQHHDRKSRSGPDRAAEIEAVGVGKAQVEDREPDVVLLERL